jgi:cation/acetate symporter
VQAFQYWLKLTALLVPVFVLLAVWLADGAADPAAAAPASWSIPLASPGGGIGLYTTYSLIVATFLGTMGLPHVVVRFYTNPDGRAARRTTLAVLGLLGIFYVLPPVYAALGRIYAPSLIDGRSDVLVLELPSLMVGGAVGAVLTGLVTAGAFAAFLSTSSGLTIAVAGVLSQDVTGRRWGSHRLGGVAAFRVAAAIAVVVPLLLSLPAQDVAVARTVGLAFAVTASTFAPLLMLGIWWRGLTPVGAVAGLLVGGLGSGFAVAWTLATSPSAGWASAMLGQPAAWSVPAAFLTMVAVSRLTRASVPAHAGRFMVRLHTPEAVELQR